VRRIRLGLVGLGALCLWSCARPAATPLGVYRGRLTLAKDDGGNLPYVDRTLQPDVYFRVTLKDAPVGRRLPLSCAWLDPAGGLAHQNVYTTLEVTKPVWETHCHWLIGTAAAPGTWKVELSNEGRVLLTHPFEVR